MSLSASKKEEITNLIVRSIRNKLKKHNPETSHMPFHTRLLGKDRMALYSFIHSLNTNFGTSIFEPIAICLAKSRYKVAKKQFKAPNLISQTAQVEIQKIIDKLNSGDDTPDKTLEVKRIRKVCRKGEMEKVKPLKVDIYLENHDGEIFLIDIKTAKPNLSAFKGHKRDLLEWVALFLADKPGVKVHSMIGIPYNPYDPKPYSRWTMRGMLDLEHELKVGKELWDFLGGKNSYKPLLNCFEMAGIEVRKELNTHFRKFKIR